MFHNHLSEKINSKLNNKRFRKALGKKPVIATLDRT